MRRLGRVWVWIVVPCTFWSVNGCETKEIPVQASSHVPPQPSWIMTPPPPSGGYRYYVGVALAENVLDEQGARRRALANAAENAAMSLATDVESQMVQRSEVVGAAHKGQEKPSSQVTEELKARTGEILRGLIVKEYHTEQWKIKEGPLNSYKRYKYYVLTAYPDKEYQRLLGELSR